MLPFHKLSQEQVETQHVLERITVFYNCRIIGFGSAHQKMYGFLGCQFHICQANVLLISETVDTIWMSAYVTEQVKILTLNFHENNKKNPRFFICLSVRLVGISSFTPIVCFFPFVFFVVVVLLSSLNEFLLPFKRNKEKSLGQVKVKQRNVMPQNFLQFHSALIQNKPWTHLHSNA